jgi:DivIVA domain-containing protein
MEMSPQRVRNAEFKTVRKGADPDEVRVFLNDVADELERAQNQSTAMEARARAAVARLQEVSESGAAAPAPTVEASPDESETISRTLLLAQRTADTAVAEARGEAARIVGAANDEAATTLDSTREMAAQLLDEARIEARRLGEAERLAIAGEVESLKARRDFLESDVQQLELFLTEQRSRLREAATSLVDITERIPGGLGEVRRPLLSASDDEPTWSTAATSTGATHAGGRDGGEVGDENAASASATVDTPAEDDLVIMTDVAAEEPAGDEASVDDTSGDIGEDATQAMPSVGADRDDGREQDADDFRFSFDNDRS